jgi:hypothetical protein
VVVYQGVLVVVRSELFIEVLRWSRRGVAVLPCWLLLLLLLPVVLRKALGEEKTVDHRVSAHSKK